jgi:hypothetical protein
MRTAAAWRCMHRTQDATGEQIYRTLALSRRGHGLESRHSRHFSSGARNIRTTGRKQPSKGWRGTQVPPGRYVSLFLTGWCSVLCRLYISSSD